MFLDLHREYTIGNGTLDDEPEFVIEGKRLLDRTRYAR